MNFIEIDGVFINRKYIIAVGPISKNNSGDKQYSFDVFTDRRIKGDVHTTMIGSNSKVKTMEERKKIISHLNDAKYTPKLYSDVLNNAVIDIFSSKLYRILSDADIEVLGELTEITEKEFIKLSDCTDIGIKEIKKVFEELGINFKGKKPRGK